MVVTRQKMVLCASSINFTTPWTIVERYSSKNRFKKLQIAKIPPWHKEGLEPIQHKSVDFSKSEIPTNFKQFSMGKPHFENGIHIESGDSGLILDDTSPKKI